MLTILLTLGTFLALYLLVAAFVYRSMMPRNANAMQKSMSLFVMIMAMGWPLLLAVKVLKLVKGKAVERD